MEREGSTGLGSEIVKGEDGCEFAAWNKPLLLECYLEISSPQRTIMFPYIFPASHKFTCLNFQNQWIGGVKFAWLSGVSVYWVECLLGACQKSQWGFSGCSCCSGPFSTGTRRRCVDHLMKSSLITKITLWATSVKWQRWYQAEWNTVFLAKISDSGYPVSVAEDCTCHHQWAARSVRSGCWLANISSHNCLLFTSSVSNVLCCHTAVKILFYL